MSFVAVAMARVALAMSVVAVAMAMIVVPMAVAIHQGPFQVMAVAVVIAMTGHLAQRRLLCSSSNRRLRSH